MDNIDRLIDQITNGEKELRVESMVKRYMNKDREANYLENCADIQQDVAKSLATLKQLYEFNLLAMYTGRDELTFAQLITVSYPFETSSACIKVMYGDREYDFFELEKPLSRDEFEAFADAYINEDYDET